MEAAITVIPEDMSDLQDCIMKSAGGDAEAFRTLFDHIHDPIFRYLLSRSSSRDDALDALQEVFIDIWKALGSFEYRSDKQFYGFMFRITKRRLIKYYRSKKYITIEFDEHFVTDNYQMPYEDYTRLWQWLGQLKPKYQELLRLRYWSGMSFQEIAAVLEIKEGTAKVWHHRAIKRIEQLANSS